MLPKYTDLIPGPAAFSHNFPRCTKNISKGVTHQSGGLASLRSRKGRWLWQTCSHCRDGMHQDGEFPAFLPKVPLIAEESLRHSYKHSNNNHYPLFCPSSVSYCPNCFLCSGSLNLAMLWGRLFIVFTSLLRTQRLGEVK